jgi:glucose/arabinose dehydrogenase
VQGLAWDADGTLWATEHGPSGELNGWCCHDELNRIQKGGHYGWPYVKGDDTHPGTAAPIAHSGMDTWAPGGCAVLGEDWGGFAGSVVLGGLRGEQLRRIERSWNPRNMRYEIKENAWFKGRFGRLRNVLVAADGTTLYVSTSNRDGRGRARSGDDRILVVKPKYGN